MKKLELNQMELFSGGADCSGQEAAFAIANAAIWYAAFVAGPVGFLIATAAFTVAYANLLDCQDSSPSSNSIGSD